MKKEKLGILKQVITLIIIFITCLSMNSTVLAAQDWSAVWEETMMYGGGKVEWQNASWDMADTYILAAQQMTEQEIKGLTGDDRLGFVQFVSAFVKDNTNKLQSEKQSSPNTSGPLAQVYKSMEEKVNILNNISGLTETEKTMAQESKAIVERFNSGGNGYDSYEDFLANASTPEKINARVLGGYFDKAGNLVELTDEQIDEITNDVGEEIDETNEAAEAIDEEIEANNKSEQSILDRKPIGLLPEQDGDGEITVDETIEGAMDFVNSGR